MRKNFSFPGQNGYEIPAILHFQEKGKKNKAVILAHGWKASKEHKLIYRLAQRFEEEGWTTLRFDFHSQEKVLEPYLEDLRSALQYMKSCLEVDSERIALVGHSLGGISALYFGLEEKMIKAIATIGAPIRFDEKELEHAETPTLIVHGDQDERIALEDGKKLYSLLGEKTSISKEMKVIEGGDHRFQEQKNADKVADAILKWLIEFI